MKKISDLVKEISLNELLQVVNSSFDGIVISDSDGRQIIWNEAIEKITGLNNSDYDVIMSQDLVKTGVIDQSVTLKVLESNQPVTLMQQINTGKKLLVSGVPIRNETGKIVKVVCNVRDMTELNLLQEEVLKLTQQNEQVNRELQELKKKQTGTNQLVATDPNMKETIDRALTVSRFDSTVLILGESGVGKEGLVQFIHHHSNRKNNPLIQVNCGAIPEQLLESELFGYESGSFTGAKKNGKKGLFEASSGGTIFLDEIGEMPLSLQVKLLRVLQEHEITRIGGIIPIKVDIRVIAATNRDLKEMIQKGEFREDLFYRLNIIPIYVHPLRERKNDIIPLINHFLNRIEKSYGIHRIFSEDALEALMGYPWPGNVRELQNLVERVSLLVNKPIIHLSDIQNELNKTPNTSTIETKTKIPQQLNSDRIPLKKQVEEFEMNVIQQTLAQYPSIRKAAKALQLDSSTLVRKLQKYNI